MVSSTSNTNGDASISIKSKPAAEGIPAGDYRLVGWDLDATGKKLVDEICQIAAYTPNSSFAQYVMPYKDISPPAKKRHNLKIVTMGNYRRLKSSKTNKVLPTKSEISAITDFLNWLETIKGDAADGIILVHHEPRKVIPAMLLNALKKYNLLEKFKKCVKGFANGFNVASANCADSIRTFSLRTLSRVLLNQEIELDNAVERARLALQIVHHLSCSDEKVTASDGSGDSNTTNKATVELIRKFIQPIDAEESEYESLKVVLERQHNLKPIFKPLLAATRRERQHATPLRRLLAESDIDYPQLEKAWSDGKIKGVETLINKKVVGADEKELVDLLEVLECHFDPEKKPKIQVEAKPIRKHHPKKKENQKDVVDKESPDTTTVQSPEQSPKASDQTKDVAEIAA